MVRFTRAGGYSATSEAGPRANEGARRPGRDRASRPPARPWRRRAPRRSPASVRAPPGRPRDRARSSRAGRRDVVLKSGWMTPCATCPRRVPSPGPPPNQSAASLGVEPEDDKTTPIYSLRFGHLLVGDVEVGIDVLHVVVIVERLRQIQRNFGVAPGQRLPWPWASTRSAMSPRRASFPSREHRPPRSERVGRRGQKPLVAAGRVLLGPGPHGDIHELVLGRARDRDLNDALPLERPPRRRRAADAPRCASRISCGSRRPCDFGCPSSPRRGTACRPARCLRRVLPRTPLLRFHPCHASRRGRAEVAGHRLPLGVRDGLAQARVPVRIAAAHAGAGDRELLDELGEELAALGVERALLCA